MRRDNITKAVLLSHAKNRVAIEYSRFREKMINEKGMPRRKKMKD